ncbi:SAM-dependent methyltransferase [Natrialba sp. SSL1]|uniref:SAM-dependent methyltransferase n=1 Tax=Natrialba sp. SSL1 TaxID=1869245 RepID=UPI0008F86790|nr:SAM-dependent methyltransferase [Natrialba sp. SSL1]OIB59032.1 tRNA (N6-threonylcarbamoyladenosine(37)-N6)-methyltransferase TrmO [Natrialba sp. SSL1]
MTCNSPPIELDPIGIVHSPRETKQDDGWGDVKSSIELDSTRFTPAALAGLDDFSHVEVVFVMHRVREENIEHGARHPRNNPDWPEVGIFAQRAKGRPNRIGVSRCQIRSVDELTIDVIGLDAIDGTPVVAIKPYMNEFGPNGDVTQPTWAAELMATYYDDCSH